MKVLVLNCGSSTLKFQLIETGMVKTSALEEKRLARGLIDRIGGESLCTFDAAGSASFRETAFIRDHRKGVETVLAWLDSNPTTATRNVGGVGHRVVHGGDRFASSVVIDDEVLRVIETLQELAPLHNPPAVSGIQAARDVLGDSVPMVAAFDTSFHRTLPDCASTYAIPYDLSDRHKIKRYGFHGLAHRYSALRYVEIRSLSIDPVKIVTLHLGNGCSAAAIRQGQSIDTSMGFTPLEGLMMGTRSGDLDPAIVSYLVRKEGISAAHVETWLNTNSGLLGVSGRSNDMRELLSHAPADARARLAVEIFCYRARKYLGAYLAALGGAEAVIFSGGIGENSPPVRQKICEGMDWCGIQLDMERNTAIVGTEGRISLSGTPIHTYVIPTDEEVLIARDTAGLLEKRGLQP